MGFVGGKVFLCIIFWLLALALFFQAVGLVVDYWWYASLEIPGGGPGSGYGGLWSVCFGVDIQSFKICITYEQISDIEGWFLACRGLALGGACLIFLAIMCCFSAVISSGGRMCRLVTALLCFLAFFVIIAEWALFVGKIQSDGWATLDMWPPEDNIPVSQLFVLAVDSMNYYASFAVTIMADVLCLLCGVLALVSWRANGVSPV